MLARKNKISPMYEFKVSPLSLFLSLFFFENSLGQKKRKEHKRRTKKGEKRTRTLQGTLFDVSHRRKAAKRASFSISTVF